jgi:para-nitrobenzyl esterase
LAYVFNSLDRADRPWEPRDREIAEAMSSYWANFVRTGNPNGPGLSRWPALDASRPETMELGERFGPRPVAAPEKVALFEALLPTPPPATAR